MSAVLFWSCLGALPAAAANLLQNPGFQSNLNGWQAHNLPAGTGVWSGLDAHGVAGSGSGLVTNTQPFTDATLTTISQCVPVTAGEPYRAAFDVRIPTGQANTGRAGLLLYWASDLYCTSVLTTQLVAETSAVDTWVGLSGAGTAPAGAQSFLFGLWVQKYEAGGSFRAHFDNAFLGPVTGPCVASDGVLCLADSRFKVEATWRQASGATGAAHAVSLSADSGYFWFFNAANAELFVKVKNACVAPFDRFWVFAAGLTNVRVVLTVTDTETGEVKTYVNPLNQAFQPIQDTQAFATCP